jgi:hypothetical protein
MDCKINVTAEIDVKKIREHNASLFPNFREGAIALLGDVFSQKVESYAKSHVNLC